MNCSVIIRAFNEEKHISRLLTGITQQTLKDVEIILVDSGSTDHTVEIALRYPVKVVHIQPNEFTFGRSLNRGIAAAQSEYVVIASAHVYPVYPDWLETLIEPFSEQTCALTYGKQRGCSTTQFSEHQIFSTWFAEQSCRRQFHPFCNNANAAIRRSLWQKHPYDETLPALEDLAWAKWALDQGLGIAYVSEAEIIHVHNERPRGVYNRYRREGMAFKQIYPHEHFRLTDFIRLFTANMLSDMKSARKKRVLGVNWKSIVWFRLMQFWGTYRGFRQSGPLAIPLKQAFYYPAQPEMIQEKFPRSIEPIWYNEGSDVRDSIEQKQRE